MAKIFKPRRGKKSTMAGTKKTTVLSAGEMFIEVPDTGAGTGHSKMKIGDGSTQYSSLPYAMGDTENDKIAFSNDTSGNITTALNKVTSGAALKTMIAALKQAVSLANTSITQLNDEQESLKQSFQDGCNTIYQACIDNGVTPDTNSPEDIVEAINSIKTMFGGVKSLTVLYIYAGPEYSTNAYTYTCPNDGYYAMVAGGRVMDGAYITKNSVTQSVTKSNGGYDCFVFRSVFSVKSGDKIASSCSGHGSNGCMVKADLIAY